MRRMVCIVALALSALTAPPAAASFCTVSTTHDYAVPLAGMPALPQLASGKTTLPFSPSGVVLTYHPPGQVILPGTEGVGFAISVDPNRRKPARPRWLASATLAKVTEAGSTERLLETQRARVEKLAPHHPVGLGLGLTGEPGFYRVQIVFRDRTGKLLGRYGEYIRIIAGSLDVGFVLDKSVFHPGETLEPQLENGAAYLSFGLGAPIEVMEGGAWVPAPFGNGPVPAIGMVLGAGQAASCWPRTIPADAAPGTYRIGLAFTYQTRVGRLPIGSGETRYAEFTVAP